LSPLLTKSQFDEAAKNPRCGLPNFENDSDGDLISFYTTACQLQRLINGWTNCLNYDGYARAILSINSWF